MRGTSSVRTILSVAIAMVFVVYTTDLLILIWDLKPSRKTRSGAYRTQLSFASLHFESLFFSLRNITWRAPFSKIFHFWRDAAVVCDDLSYRSNSSKNYSKLYSSLRQTFIEAAHGSWLCEWSGHDKLCTYWIDSEVTILEENNIDRNLGYCAVFRTMFGVQVFFKRILTARGMYSISWARAFCVPHRKRI